MDETTFHRRLRAEVETWCREGIIPAELAKTLTERYAEGSARSRQTLAGGLIAMLGAVLLGIGVIALFASNWETIPGWAKLGSIVAAFVTSYATGYRLRFHGTTFRGTGDALLFLGAPLYGASLFLIANGYQIPIDSPLLLTLLGLGILPLAWVLVSRTQWALAILAIGVAVAMEAVGWVAQRPSWVLGTLIQYAVLTGGVGQLLFGHPTRGSLAEPARNLALLATFWCLVPLGFADVHRFDDYGFKMAADPGFLQRIAALGLVALAAHAVAWMRSPRGRLDTWVGAAWATVMVGIGVSLLDRVPPGAAAAIANTVNFALILGLIAYAYATRTPYLLNTAVLFFSIQTGCRYVDLFYETWPPEVFFLTLGALLLFGGMLVEKGRRRMIRSWSEPTTQGGAA
ncbi:MAG: DUF2157 domain-containing protein [Armatimonadota bacterium]